MAISLYDVSVAAFLQTVGGVAGFLDGQGRVPGAHAGGDGIMQKTLRLFGEGFIEEDLGLRRRRIRHG